MISNKPCQCRSTDYWARNPTKVMLYVILSKR